MTMITSADLIADPIGRFPSATVACFDPTRGESPRRELDAQRTIAFLERLAGLNVPAVLIAASTGHGHVRTMEELAFWYRCAAKADLRETARTALLRPEDGVEANRRLIATLQEQGYPIVFTRPGSNLSAEANDQQVAENLRPIVVEAARCGLAVGVYSIPDVSGMPLSANATALLVNGPGGDHIVAAKVTEANYETSTLTYLEHPELKHLKIVQGWDTFLARALQDGPRFDEHGRERCGVTSGPMSFSVFQYLHILEAARRGDWPEVDSAQQAVTALFISMQDDPAKFADLQRAKYIMGLGHPLTGTVTEPQVQRVFAALDNVPRPEDKKRLARSLDLMEDGPYHNRLQEVAEGKE